MGPGVVEGLVAADAWCQQPGSYQAQRDSRDCGTRTLHRRCPVSVVIWVRNTRTDDSAQLSRHVGKIAVAQYNVKAAHTTTFIKRVLSAS